MSNHIEALADTYGCIYIKVYSWEDIRILKEIHTMDKEWCWLEAKHDYPLFICYESHGEGEYEDRWSSVTTNEDYVFDVSELVTPLIAAVHQIKKEIYQ